MKKIQRIMFIAPKIVGGGAERVVSVLASSLADQGYHVDLVLYERRDDEYPLSEKVKIHLLPDRKAGQSKITYMVGKFLYLRNVIKTSKSDVLVPFLPYQVEQCFLASRGLHIPMVVTVRNNPQFDTPNEKMRKRRDWIARHTEAVFVQNEEQKAYFDAVTQKKCFVVPNPINKDILDSDYQYSGSIKRFVTMGRLSEQKNHKLLIAAFAEVLRTHVDLTLDIYGSGVLKENLQHQIDELGVSDSIRLCGRTENVAETLAKYDAFVMSSDYEGMPNALMEAMGVGLVCISTDCPTGPKELIGNDERGVLTEVKCEQELIQALCFVTENAQEVRRRAENARKYIIDNFAPKTIAEKLMEAIALYCK